MASVTLRDPETMNVLGLLLAGFLKSALARDERLRAQADYALALLVRGRESDGIRLLDQVQSEFEAAGMYDQAHQCLWNKSKYFEKTKQSERLQTATAEMADLEARIY